MDPCLVVSPHLDDAVLSVGQFLASWPGCRVMTLFAGMPPKEKITTFDVSSEFPNSSVALTARWHEDDRALDVLGATPIRCEFVDNQYREPGEELDLIAMKDSIVAAYRDGGCMKLIGPLGLAHVDHEVTSKAVLMAAVELGCETWLYEELPARVLWPEMVPVAVERARDFKFAPVLGFIGSVPSKERKRRAIECYKSQLWALDSDVLYVPERVWQMAR